MLNGSGEHEGRLRSRVSIFRGANLSFPWRDVDSALGGNMDACLQRSRCVAHGARSLFLLSHLTSYYYLLACTLFPLICYPIFS